MTRTQYPGSEDLGRLLAGMGWTAGDQDLTGAVDAAVREFEERTGRTMLAPASDAVRAYDPPVAPDGVLELGADLAGLTSLVYQPQGASPETLTHYVDFWLLELNASQQGKPWTALRVRRRWLGPLPESLLRSILITGRWGYGATLPGDVWSAMLHRAAMLLIPQQGYVLTAGRVRTVTAGVETAWGDEPLAGLAKGWEREFEAAVGRYRR